MRTLFAYELLNPPYDEGVKNFSLMVSTELKKNHPTKLIKYFKNMPIILNNLIYIPRLIIQGVIYNPDICIYIPQASLTFSSYIKITILNLLYGSKLVIIGTQKRKLSAWQQSIVKRLTIPHTFVISKAMAEDISGLGINSYILNIGIDIDKYRPVDNYIELREKYRLPLNKKIILHVGHIRESRNIRWLIDVQNELQDAQVVIVGSTSTPSETELCSQLIGAGIVVIRDYIPDVYELYQLSDYYCFPVVINTAAMEVPLSVLESMSTNIPVLTTRFGRLPELFTQDACFHYINDASDIIHTIKNGFGSACNNREKITDFTWSATANNLLAHAELFR